MPDLQTKPLKEIHNAEPVPEGIYNIEGKGSQDQGDIILPVFGQNTIVVEGWFQGFFLDIGKRFGLFEFLLRCQVRTYCLKGRPPE